METTAGTGGAPAARSQDHVFDSAALLDPDRPPADPEALHAWLAEALGLRFPRRALVPGHSAPFDYLCWSFFEGLGRLAPADADPAPVDAVVWAGRGGGKTFAGAVATLLDLVFKPGIEVRILAGSLDQAAHMHRHLAALFERPLLADLLRGRITERRLELASGSRVEVLAQSQTSVRGMRVQKVRCDEVELFDQHVWEAAQLTTRSRTLGRFRVRGSVECLSTMHIPGGIMQTLLARGGAGRAVFKWGIVDILGPCEPGRPCRGPLEEEAPASNGSLVSLPILTAPDDTLPRKGDCPLWPECAGRAKDKGREPGHMEIADAISMKSRVGEAQWASEMLCLRPRRTDAVLPEFDPAVHIVDALPWESPPASAECAWLAGIDFGFRAPTVILWAARDTDGRLWVAHERSIAECTLATHIDALADPARPRPAWVGVDPAGAQRSSQTGHSSIALLKEAGFAVRAAALPLRTGLSLLRARLRPAADPTSPRLFIHRRCKVLIESMERYHYPPGRDDREDPVKDGSDHAVDALRYLIGNLDAEWRTRVRTY